MQTDDTTRAAGTIPPTGEADDPLEAWAPEEFDYFADLGLVRVLDEY